MTKDESSEKKDVREKCAYVVGVIAALLMTISFLPQLVETFKSRGNGLGGVSVPMYCLFILSVVLWLTYGIVTRNTLLIGSNIVMFVLSSAVLVITVIHKSNNAIETKLRQVKELLLQIQHLPAAIGTEEQNAFWNKMHKIIEMCEEMSKLIETIL